MAKSQAPLSICSIVQMTEPKYFYGWTDEEQDALAKGAGAIADVLAAKLQNAGYKVQEIHCIIHDRDKHEVWDDNLNNFVVELKARHFHAAVKFALDKETGKVMGGTLAQIASAIGVEPQYVEKAEKGRYAWDNMLSYLIHIKYADKEPYSPDEVYSAGITVNGVPQYKSYLEIYRERKKAWEDGKAKVSAKQANMNVELLEEKILTGEVKRSQVLLTDALFNIYARNKRRIDDAFDIYAERKIAKTIQAMENGEFKVSVIYVTGKSHSGKSIFTEYLVKAIQEDAREKFGEDWEVCACAASNPFDEYRGEEILVMDDLRGIAMSASDWLKLLDPDRVNVGSARYHNRRVACRAIIINSEKDILDYFFYVRHRGDVNEAMDQFFRRIMARAVVYRVPDVPDVRRLLVGEMQETEPYVETEPGSASKQLTLHHDFKKDYQDMSYTDALHRLANMVMQRNGINAKNTDVARDLTPQEQEAFEDRIIEEDQEERRERDESILKAEEERYEAEIDEAVRLYQMRKAREEY